MVSPGIITTGRLSCGGGGASLKAERFSLETTLSVKSEWSPPMTCPSLPSKSLSWSLPWASSALASTLSPSSRAFSRISLPSCLAFTPMDIAPPGVVRSNVSNSSHLERAEIKPGWHLVQACACSPPDLTSNQSAARGRTRWW